MPTVGRPSEAEVVVHGYVYCVYIYKIYTHHIENIIYNMEYIYIDVHIDIDIDVDIYIYVDIDTCI